MVLLSGLVRCGGWGCGRQQGGAQLTAAGCGQKASADGGGVYVCVCGCVWWRMGCNRGCSQGEVRLDAARLRDLAVGHTRTRKTGGGGGGKRGP